MTTVAEFWDEYREAILASVRPHTASGYEVAWRRRVRESFGNRTLRSITTFEIEAAAATWQVKYSTKRDALACLSKIMKGAAKSGLVPVNPCLGVELGRQEEGDPTGRALSRYFDDVSLARQGGYTGEIAFGTGLESGHTALTWSDVSDSIVNVSTPLSSLRTNESSRSGSASLRVSGTDNNATISYAINRVFDVDIPVTATTKLSYWALPTNENGRHVVVDLIFTDGSTLRDSGAVDFEGISMHPNVARGIVGTWRQVQSKIGQWTAGKTIDRIIVDYDYPLGTGGYNAYLDDIYIQN